MKRKLFIIASLVLSCSLISGCGTASTDSETPAQKEETAAPKAKPSYVTDSNFGISMRIRKNWAKKKKIDDIDGGKRVVYKISDSEIVTLLGFKNTSEDACKEIIFPKQVPLVKKSETIIDGQTVEITGASTSDSRHYFVYYADPSGYGIAAGIISKKDDKGSLKNSEAIDMMESIKFNVDQMHADIPDGFFTVEFYDGIPESEYSMSVDAGSLLKEESVPAGGSATPPETPVRDGYVFTGWNGDYTNVQGNTTLVAQWDPVGSEDVSSTLPERTKGQLVANAQSCVEDQLKSPSSAKFPWDFAEYQFYRRGLSSTHPGYTRYVVKGYVDAENSFGASMRTNFAVTMDYQSGESTYYVIDCSVG